jgi:hypothetical protein
MLEPGNSNRQAIRQAKKDHSHNFPRKRRKPTERCARHHDNGALILVPAAPTMIPSIGGPKPPPTRSMRIDRRIRTKPPFFL